MPLTFDLSMDQLKTYRGTNPRPDDFDEYWDRALSEMKAVNPDVETRKTDFQVPGVICRDLYFTGTGGARVHAMLASPEKPGKSHPGLVRFHGYSGNAGSWTSLFPWAQLGFTIAAMDCRGQGGSSEDAGSVKGTTFHGHIVRGLDDHPDRLMFRQIFLDTAQLAGIIMDMQDVDENRVGVFGGSQGGGLTLACAALEPRVKRAAPEYPFLCDYKRVWDMDLAEGAYRELKDFFRRHDPRHERENEIFTRLGYIDVHHLAPRIKADVLMFCGLQDTTCPPSTQHAAYNNIKSSKQVIYYPDFSHETLPGADDKTVQFMLGL